MRRTLLSSLIGAIVLAIAVPAFSFSIGDLINRDAGAEHFRIIHVQDLVRLIADHSSHAYIYDANPQVVRERYGVIPNARLIDDPGNYDLSILPPDHHARLIFYCHNRL